MKDWTRIPSDEDIQKTVEALNKNGINTFVYKTGEEAKKKFFELVHEGSEVFTNTSTTLDVLGINQELNESGKYKSLKNRVSEMPSGTPEKDRQKRMIGSVPEFAVGSVHAVTLDGRLMIASGSGSQIPGYAYGADRIVWVIGAHKIVKDIEEGLKRINEYSLPLESKRINKVYNTTRGSAVRKLLIFNLEPKPGRANAIIVKEPLGF